MCDKCQMHSGVATLVDTLEKKSEKVDENLLEIFGRVNKLEISDGKRDEQILSLCDKLTDITTTLDRWLDFGKEIFWKIFAILSTLIVALLGLLMYLIKVIWKLPV